ncbi:MAG: hypothetical protein PSX80_12975 [bacterium]|nr:hypothetical protein [bacterium]
MSNFSIAFGWKAFLSTLADANGISFVLIPANDVGRFYGIGKYFLSRFAYPSAMYSDQAKSKRYRNFFSEQFRRFD